jgi:PAS domain S-box-containing protein
MTDTSIEMNGSAKDAAPPQRPDAAAHRVAELETEIAALRRALARAGMDAARVGRSHAGELAEERAGRAAAAARSAATAAKTRHGRAVAAGRTDPAAREAENGALGRANTELAESRAALGESEERLRLILDSAADYAIFTTGPDRRVSSWNAGAERLLGWTAEEVVGRSADLIFTPEDRAAGVPEREAAKALAEGRASNERWHLRKDGSRFWGSGLTMALRGAEGDPPPPPLGLLVIMRDRTERRRAEERRELLVHELNHRVKNTLAVVQSLAAQTARGAPDLPSFGAAFQARLIALARAHDLLTREDWVGAPLHAVARAALEPLAIDETRVDLSGCASDVVLPPGAALALAMAVHELATNALKHGALSAPDGRVSVACRGAADPGGGAPVVEWVERGGPPVAGPPAKRGFGLRLLGRGLMAQAGVGADLRFEPEGVRCTLRLPSPLPTASPANEP